MPYRYIYEETEVAYFTKQDGEEINIYRTYEDNDYDSPHEYWFTLDAETSGEDYAYEFDIREFVEYDEFLSIRENFDILTMKGYITKDGWKYNLNDKLTTHYLKH